MSRIIHLLYRSQFARTSIQVPLSHVRHMHKTEFQENVILQDTALRRNVFVTVSQNRFQSTGYQTATGHEKIGILGRFKKRIFGFYSDQAKIKMAACLVYEKCADGIDWNQFLKYFGLPDTFQSWFLAIQLHVWMCCLVGVSEKKGRQFRNGLVDAMWSDVEIRLSHLAEMRSSRRKEYLSEMVDQFQACLISYDEGILGDDTVLAAAVWRTIFNFRNIDPRLLENMVLYIRCQISHLDSLNSENLIMRGSISFLPLNSIVDVEEVL